METYKELQDELGTRLMSASNSTLYTATRKKELILNALLWAYGYHEWPETVRAKTTDTTTNTYYDYPVEFRTDSVLRVEIDGIEYEKVEYQDFMDYKISHASQLNTPVAGVNNLDIWGCIQPELPVNDGDPTIFSYHSAEANEAVVKRALSVAIAKINKNLSVLEDNEAKVILNKLWEPIELRQQHKKRLDRPLFNVPNFFGPKAFSLGSLVQDEKKYIFADYYRKIFIASFT